MEFIIFSTIVALVSALLVYLWRDAVKDVDYWERQYDRAYQDLDEYREEAIRLRKTLRQIESAMKGGGE